MAITTSHSMLTTLIFFFLLIVSSLDSTSGRIGVCFGRLGNNLPCVQTTIAMYKRYNIRSMRLYDPHHPTLRALSGTGIRLMLGIPNDLRLRDLANCPDAARHLQKKLFRCASDEELEQESVPDSVLH